MAGARAAARANVRIAPRRWRLRPVVEVKLALLSRFAALAKAVLGTACAATRPLDGAGPLPLALRSDLASFGAGIRRLAETKQPWPQVALDDVRAIAHQIIARASSEPVDPAAVVASLLHTSGLDLSAIMGDRILDPDELRTSETDFR